MAEKILNTRIALKIDTLENWNSSTLGLKKGELALATVAASAGTGLKEPVVMVKIGEDGVKTFKDLEWNFYAKASDVLSACKTEDGLKAFINGVIADAGIATSDAMEALAGRVSDVEGLIGEKAVATQISEAIAALKLGETYDAKGDAAQALTDAKAYADELNNAMDTRVDALEAIDHEHANKEELDKIAAGDKAKWDAMEQNAKDYADDLDEAMDSRVQALEAKFGDGEGNVEAQISAAVAAEKTARENADAGLQEQITANASAIEALDGLVGNTAVATQISTAVAAEAEIARAAEKANADEIAAIKEDYLKAADKTELQNQINTIMNNPDTEGVINSINEFTQYIADHGEIAEGFRTDIDANAGAIAAIKEDYLKAADKNALQGEIDAVEGRMDTAEGKITALEGSVATKAAASDVTALAGRVTTAEGKVTTLEGEMDTAQADIEALETKVGDKSVSAQITAAIEALKIGDYAKASDLSNAVDRIAQNETDIAALEGRMDTAEGKITTLEGEVAKKANDADLAAIAKSGNVNDLVQTTGDVLVFDCGTSAV